MEARNPAPERQTLGSWQGVSIDIAAWDGVAADVDLSIACMFVRELDDGLRGGLLHLDNALSGRLVRLRDEGVFTGDRGETLLVSLPPPTVVARAVMMIGMGEPSQWTPAATAHAVTVALGAAVHLGATRAAFAPSLLDSGLAPSATVGVAPAMMKAVMRAIDVHMSIAAHGLAAPPSLRRWVFDVGAAGFSSAAAQFSAALGDR